MQPIRFRWILAGSPLGYALTYLALIPLFALVFLSYQAEFVQTTAKYEPEAARIRVEATEQITQFINEWLKDLPRQVSAQSREPVTSIFADASGVNALMWTHWNTKPRLIQRPGDREPIQTVEVKSWGTNWKFQFPPVHPLGPDGGRLAVIIENMPNWVASESRPPIMGGNATGGFRNIQGHFVGLSNDEDPESQNISLSGTALVSVSFYRAVERFYRIENGQPIDTWLGFGRFLYFSAVTATTLGYGDIVPISDRARFLISLEAVLGVVLIGLFLNSLASKHSQRT